MSLRVVFEWTRDGERCHYTDQPVEPGTTEIHFKLVTEGFTTTARVFQRGPQKDDKPRSGEST